MSRRPKQSTDRQSKFSRTFATDFDATILHNSVWDAVDDDDQLAQLCDAAALADHAADTRESEISDDEAEPVRQAWGELEYAARRRALEVVAEQCATLLEDGHEWIGEAWDAREVAEGQREARFWLRSHSNEATRADVYGAAFNEGEA